MNIQKLLSDAVSCSASDLHLIVGLIPAIRVDGAILPLPHASVLSVGECSELVKEFLSAEQQEQYFYRKDYDVSYAFENLHTKQQHRCRINLFQDLSGNAFSIRFIPTKIPTIRSLQLPHIFEELIQKENGLILITGPTGSGKTTTLTAMLDAINETRAAHILTLEDPIEYIHSPKKSILSQREIGQTAASFSSGLKAALREDPDIILVGEMRDPETVEIALNAAETGHLVLSTLHTANVVEAIDRVLQYFPDYRQKQIQQQLANCIEGIIAQKLLPKKNQPGRVAAFEILTRTPATINLIRTGEAFRLQDFMHQRDGMQTMGDAIADLRQRNVIA
ncbi:MAG: PilT/PilU family type 4a pilus ATPase [Smithella sp.]